MLLNETGMLRGRGFALVVVSLLACIACQPMKGLRGQLNQEELRVAMSADLAVSKAAWEASKPASGNYKFRYRTHNGTRRIALTIYISDNKLTDIESARGVRLTWDDIVRLMALDLSVEGLFKDVEEGIRSTCVPYVQFDQSKGYPRRIQGTCQFFRYEIDRLELL